MTETLQNYITIAFMIVGAGCFALTPLAIAYFLAPRKPSVIKNDTYECGLKSEGDSWIQFKLQYYLYALAFVIFDIEAIFIYPWAVTFTEIGIGGFLAMALFVLILAESLIYLWAKGLLEWQ